MLAKTRQAYRFILQDQTMLISDFNKVLFGYGYPTLIETKEDILTLQNEILSPNYLINVERIQQIIGRSTTGALTYIEQEACCAIHEFPLDESGECAECEQHIQEALYEQHLAHMERLADCQAEIDDDSTLEENIGYY